MTEGQEPTTSAEQDVWPTILELQKVLVERLRGAGEAGRLRPTEGLFSISITSCEHHSCQ
jgi:hypothetical protein